MFINPGLAFFSFVFFLVITNTLHAKVQKSFQLLFQAEIKFVQPCEPEKKCFFLFFQRKFVSTFFPWKFLEIVDFWNVSLFSFLMIGTTTFLFCWCWEKKTSFVYCNFLSLATSTIVPIFLVFSFWVIICQLKLCFWLIFSFFAWWIFTFHSWSKNRGNADENI